MAETAFRGVVSFLDRLGVYDVLLPFLLVFTIVFAILEKTRVLGVDHFEGKEWTKKNLNAIVAFVIAFFVIASSKLVEVITSISSQAVILILLAVLFLMMVGVFLGGEASLKEYPGWTNFFMVITFIAIVGILLDALGWLETIIGIILLTPDTDWAATLVLLAIVIGVMLYVTRDSRGTEKGKEKSDKH